nr:BACON domain-containing carbohydrate-binding protein [Desulfosarcinaceae bacterium]
MQSWRLQTEGIRRIATILAATGFLFFLATCGGGGGGGETDPKKVTITGVVDDGGASSTIPSAICRFVDRGGVEHDEDICELTSGAQLDGRFQLSVAPGVQGYIYCGPRSMTHLNLTTFSSTVGFQAGDVKPNENVTPVTTVAADIIRFEQPSDPETRKGQLVLQAQSDPNLQLVTTLAGRLYRAMLAEQVNTSLGNDHGDGGDPDPDGRDSDGGVGGDAGDGADFSPLANAACAFVVGDDFETAQPIHATALADLLVDGKLNRPDLAALAEDVFHGMSDTSEEIQRAFAAVFPPDGLGKALATTTNAAGEYFLRIPPNLPGYVRCVPENSQQLVLGTYVPGRAYGEVRDDEHVSPATTVFSAVIAPQLSRDLKTVKENYQNDIAGLEVLLDWPDYPAGSLQGFTAKTEAATNPEVGLVAFSATALFNIFYKNALDVDYLAALADMVDNAPADPQNPVDPAFLEGQAIPAARAQALADIVNSSVDATATELGTALDAGLSTARIQVTVMSAADGSGLIPGATVTIDTTGHPDLTCTAGCGDETDARGQLTLTLSGVPGGVATPVTVSVSGVPGYAPTTIRTQVVAFATVDLDVTLSGGSGGSHRLTLQGGGEGSGNVTSLPTGIDCDTDQNRSTGSCSASFADGQDVTLTATAGAGAVFSGWSGACTGTARTCSVTMSADATVTAAFDRVCAESDISIDTAQALFDANGGQGSFRVTAPDGCPWSASSNVAWIQLLRDSGSGGGSVSYQVSANSGAERSATITVAGQAHRVTQTAGSCSYTITPTSDAYT